MFAKSQHNLTGPKRPNILHHKILQTGKPIAWNPSVQLSKDSCFFQYTTMLKCLNILDYKEQL